MRDMNGGGSSVEKNGNKLWFMVMPWTNEREWRTGMLGSELLCLWEIRIVVFFKIESMETNREVSNDYEWDRVVVDNNEWKHSLRRS